ncbi:MAG: alpha/beta hydrolase [Anaerolineae bacterium]|nr:alpha/beta hydrolase [Anaerolineae bacterium]
MIAPRRVHSEHMTTPPLFDFEPGSHERDTVLNLAIANGFPPDTYRPFLRALGGDYRRVCVLPRALWHNGVRPESAASWQVMADDLLAGLRAHSLTGVIAVGHSMGGVASMLAALAEPSRFRALVLLDPTIFPADLLRLIRWAGRLGLSHRFPLVQRALRRRRAFASVDAAYDYFRTRPLFASWPAQTVRLYAESNTRPAHGGGVELAWTPEWEAQYYRTIHVQPWRAVRRLRGLLPVLVLRGEHTDTFLERSAARFRRLVPDATVLDVPGHGHLFPHSAPDATARLVGAWLRPLKG